MSDEETGNGNKSDVHDYDDFYELLGVPESATTTEIMEASRDMLAEYHPDSSADSHARDIFKAVNKAQDILTNKEQRAVYDYLGHEKYLRKREEGNITLSDSFKEQIEKIEEEAQGSERVTDKRQNGDSNESRSDVTYGFSSLIGNKSITDLTTDIAYTTWVERVYKYVWGARVTLVVLATFIISMYGPFDGVWDVTGLLQSTTPTVRAFVLTVVVGALIGFNTSWFADSRIPQKPKEPSDSEEDDDVDVDGPVDPTRNNTSPFAGVYPDDNDENRGLNISDGSVEETAEKHPDVISQHIESDTASEDEKPKRTNRSFTGGVYSLLAVVVLLAVGSVAGDVLPITYAESLIGWSDHSMLWVGASESGILVELFNVMYVFLAAIFLVGGGAFAINGVSKRVWNAWYLDELQVPVFVWDGVLTTILATGVASLMYGDTVLTGLQVKSKFVLFDMLVFGAGVPKVIDIGIISVLLLIVVAYVVKFNIWVADRFDIGVDWSPKP